MNLTLSSHWHNWHSCLEVKTYLIWGLFLESFTSIEHCLHLHLSLHASEYLTNRTNPHTSHVCTV